MSRKRILMPRAGIENANGSEMSRMDLTMATANY